MILAAYSFGRSCGPECLNPSSVRNTAVESTRKHRDSRQVWASSRAAVVVCALWLPLGVPAQDGAAVTGRAAPHEAASARAVWPGEDRNPGFRAAWEALGADDLAAVRAILRELGESAARGTLERMLAAQTQIPVSGVEFRPHDGPREQPFRVARNGTPLVMVQVNGTQLEIGLDTGAGLTVLTESVAARVGARPLEGIRPEAINSLGETTTARLATVELTVAGVRLANLPVLVVPDDRLEARMLGVTLFSFDGLLGWNALKLTHTEFDFGRAKYTIKSSAPMCGGRNLWSIGLQPMIEASVGGRRVLAKIDTAASRSWLTATAAIADQEHESIGRVGIEAGAGSARIAGISALKDVDVAVGAHSVKLSELRIRPTQGLDPVHHLTVGQDVLKNTTLAIDGPCGRFSVRGDSRAARPGGHER